MKSCSGKYLQYLKHPVLYVNMSLFFGAVAILVYSLVSDLDGVTTNSFMRSGNIVTFIGAVLALKEQLVSFGESVKNQYVIDGGNASTDFEFIKRDSEIIICGVWVGTIIALVGSIVSGYGDLAVIYLLK